MILKIIKENTRIGKEETNFCLYDMSDYHYNEKLEDELPVAVFFLSRRYLNDNGSYNHAIIYVGKAQCVSAELIKFSKADEMMKRGVNCLGVHSCISMEEASELESKLISLWEPISNN